MIERGRQLSRLPYRMIEMGPGDALEVDASCVLVAAGGFEDRSRALLSLVRPGTTLFQEALVLRYDGDGPADRARAQAVVDAVGDVCQADPVLVDVNIDHPTASVHSLLASLSELRVRSRVSAALVDVSGLTQMFGIAVLHGCNVVGISDSVFYAEAGSYYPLETEVGEIVAQATEAGTYDYWELLQSEGLQSVHIHPEFAGSFRIDHPVALATFLGYEPSRVRGLLDEYSPAAVIALYGTPPYEKFAWRTQFSRMLHESLLRRWPMRSEEVSTFDVDEIYGVLSEVYRSLGSEYDLGIALQCSKLQMVATYWFWRDHPEVQLVFTCPISFNRARYSEGVGRQFLLTRGASVAVAEQR